MGPIGSSTEAAEKASKVVGTGNYRAADVKAAVAAAANAKGHKAVKARGDVAPANITVHGLPGAGSDQTKIMNAHYGTHAVRVAVPVDKSKPVVVLDTVGAVKAAAKTDPVIAKVRTQGQTMRADQRNGGEYGGPKPVGLRQAGGNATSDHFVQTNRIPDRSQTWGAGTPYATTDRVVGVDRWAPVIAGANGRGESAAGTWRSSPTPSAARR